jgi:uncharacterized membrane protein (DUF106 family)
MIKELMVTYPKESVIIFSFLVTLITTLITKKFTDQNRMKELKQIQKSCQIKLKDNMGNPAKMAEIQKEMMSCSMELMKHSFKPMFFTLIPLFVFFWWIRGIYAPIFSSWIWWYIGVGVVSSIILRKLLKVV